jgi:hypothetical protein
MSNNVLKQIISMNSIEQKTDVKIIEEQVFKDKKYFMVSFNNREKYYSLNGGIKEIDINHYQAIKTYNKVYNSLANKDTIISSFTINC